jgi:hypothetical protein
MKDEIMLFALPIVCGALFLLALVTTIALGMEKPRNRYPDMNKMTNKQIEEMVRKQK